MPQTREQYISDYSSAILAFTIAYHEGVIQLVLDREQYVKTTDRFFYTVIHKLVSTLEVVNILIVNLEHKPAYQISLRILIRSMLTDIITVEYVARTGQTQTEQEKIIDNINMDHLAQTYKNITSVYAGLHHFTENQIKELQDDLQKKQPNYFDEQGNLRAYTTTSIKGMIRKMSATKSKGDDLFFLKKLYSFYDLYSKYEHLGMLSFDLTHRIYDPEKLKDDFTEVFDCVFLVTTSLMGMSNVWDFIDREPLEQLHTHLLSFKPKHFPSK